MDKMIFIECVLAVCMSLNANSQKWEECSLEEKIVLFDKHEKAFISMGEKIRDSYITTGKDGKYYFTGTTAGTSWGGNGLLKSVSGKIQGPYKETGVHYDKGIDSHLL